MTNNTEILFGIIVSVINAKYNDDIPTLEEFVAEAELIRNANNSIFPVSDDEFKNLLKSLREFVLVTIGDSHSLRGIDANHQSWYPLHKNDGFYWNRYRKYLELKKKWSPEVTKRLNDTTNSIMDDLGDPTNPRKIFSRRGLLLGDVQSGKTATYTAICNKASDAGYRVIIVLTGMLENLRFQTQERLDAEFAGRESKYALDTRADQKIKNRSVGVGKIGPFDAERRISCFTSVSTDFSKKILKSNDLTLKNLRGTALFVVKKNKSVLEHLHQWLLENNADENNKIDLPLLLIDDEADNASVNTNAEDKNPTAINNGIRNILHSFYQSSYLGITATPFANIFIDPVTADGQPDDLFPRHFLTVLPTPSHYIGADSIFGSGYEHNWHIRNDGPYSDAIIKIFNNEMESYFRFKHKKTLSDELFSLPASLEEALCYFLLSTVVRDIRGDDVEHCSMMVNVSRFTDVQNRVAELVEIWLKKIQSNIEDYAMLDTEKALQIKSIQMLYAIWEKYNFSQKAECDWATMQQEFLFEAIKRIEVRAVNQSTGTTSLNYYAYKNIGLRVISVGGNSLSRGLTLEGLCVSYFYRNTMMYDTLLQMGRWFGYRPNYGDLIKIWMAEDTIDWYGYITDATNELKYELYKMERQHQTPEEFGLKVRQDPNSLIVTARNKMRTGTLVTRPITVSGRLIETPRLKNRADSLAANERACKKLISELDTIVGVTREMNESPSAMLWRNVPKKYVIELVKNFDAHPWHLNFQSQALSDYISENEKLDNWDVAIPFGSVEILYPLECNAGPVIMIKPQLRSIKEDSTMLLVSGTHVKVGAGLSTRIGLDKNKIQEIRDSVQMMNAGKPPNEHEKLTDRTFLVQERSPILMIHIINTKPVNDQVLLDKCPDFLFALGVGFPHTGEEEKTANFMVNINELKNWVEIDDGDEDDDDI